MKPSIKRIPLFIILLYACNAPETEKKDSPAIVKDVFGNEERAEKIDSLKWVYYTLNFDEVAIHTDDKKKPRQPLLACDIMLFSIKRAGDTAEYRFGIFYESEKYTIEAMGYMGVRTVKGKVNDILHGGFIIDEEPPSEAPHVYFRNKEAAFMAYMAHYKGEINPWLKAEMSRRAAAGPYAFMDTATCRCSFSSRYSCEWFNEKYDSILLYHRKNDHHYIMIGLRSYNDAEIFVVKKSYDSAYSGYLIDLANGKRKVFKKPVMKYMYDLVMKNRSGLKELSWKAVNGKTSIEHDFNFYFYISNSSFRKPFEICSSQAITQKKGTALDSLFSFYMEHFY